MESGHKDDCTRAAVNAAATSVGALCHEGDSEGVEIGLGCSCYLSWTLVFQTTHLKKHRRAPAKVRRTISGEDNYLKKDAEDGVRAAGLCVHLRAADLALVVPRGEQMHQLTRATRLLLAHGVWVGRMLFSEDGGSKRGVVLAKFTRLARN